MQDKIEREEFRKRLKTSNFDDSMVEISDDEQPANAGTNLKDEEFDCLPPEASIKNEDNKHQSLSEQQVVLKCDETSTIDLTSIPSFKTIPTQTNYPIAIADNMLIDLTDISNYSDKQITAQLDNVLIDLTQIPVLQDQVDHSISDAITAPNEAVKLPDSFTNSMSYALGADENVAVQMKIKKKLFKEIRENCLAVDNTSEMKKILKSLREILKSAT